VNYISLVEMTLNRCNYMHHHDHNYLDGICVSSLKYSCIISIPELMAYVERSNV
jgi:hypothetical protein